MASKMSKESRTQADNKDTKPKHRPSRTPTGLPGDTPKQHRYKRQRDKLGDLVDNLLVPEHKAARRLIRRSQRRNPEMSAGANMTLYERIMAYRHLKDTGGSQEGSKDGSVDKEDKKLERSDTSWGSVDISQYTNKADSDDNRSPTPPPTLTQPVVSRRPKQTTGLAHLEQTMRCKQQSSQPVLSGVSDKRSSSVAMTVVEIHYHPEEGTRLHSGDHTRDQENNVNDNENEELLSASTEFKLPEVAFEESNAHASILPHFSHNADSKNNIENTILVSSFKKISILDNSYPDGFNFTATQNKTKHEFLSSTSADESLLGANFRRRNSYKSDTTTHHGRKSTFPTTKNIGDLEKPPLKISRSLDTSSAPRLQATTQTQMTTSSRSKAGIENPVSDGAPNKAALFITTPLNLSQSKPQMDVSDNNLDIALPVSVKSNMQQYSSLQVSLSPVLVPPDDEHLEQEIIFIPKLNPAYLLFPEIIDVSKHHREYVCIPHSRSEGNWIELPELCEESEGHKDTSSHKIKTSLSAESVGDVSAQRKIRRGSHPLHNTGWERQSRQTEKHTHLGLGQRSLYELDLAQKGSDYNEPATARDVHVDVDEQSTARDRLPPVRSATPKNPRTPSPNRDKAMSRQSPNINKHTVLPPIHDAKQKERVKDRSRDDDEDVGDMIREDSVVATTAHVAKNERRDEKSVSREKKEGYVKRDLKDEVEKVIAKEKKDDRKAEIVKTVYIDKEHATKEIRKQDEKIVKTVNEDKVYTTKETRRKGDNINNKHDEGKSYRDSKDREETSRHVDDETDMVKDGKHRQKENKTLQKDKTWQNKTIDDDFDDGDDSRLRDVTVAQASAIAAEVSSPVRQSFKARSSSPSQQKSQKDPDPSKSKPRESTPKQKRASPEIPETSPWSRNKPKRKSSLEDEIERLDKMVDRDLNEIIRTLGNKSRNLPDSDKDSQLKKKVLNPTFQAGIDQYLRDI